MTNSSVCFLCTTGQPQAAFHKHGWTILRCPSCGIYSLAFHGDYQEFLTRYYNKKFFTGSTERAGYLDYEGDREAELRNMRNYVKGIQHFKSSGKLLDIGCATGLFMLEAAKAGFDVYGIDVSRYATTIARKRFGKHVRQTSIEKVHYPSHTFDVVTMFDVIEHLEYPRTVLRKVKRILRPNGLLVINTGDTDGFLAKLQGKYWHFFIPPQHFYYFSKSNLLTLLSQEGFSIRRVDRQGKWVTPRYVFHLARQIQRDVIGQIGFALVGKHRLGRLPIYINLFDNITVYASKEDEAKRAAAQE